MIQITTFLLFTILVAVISYLATRETAENTIHLAKGGGLAIMLEPMGI